MTTAELTKPANFDTALSALVEGMDPAAPLEDTFHILGMIEDIKRAATERLAEAKDIAIQAMYAHGEDDKPAEFVIGSKRWYVGHTKTVKPRDRREVAATLLESGGLDALVEGLSSDAFKHGTIRALLDDDKQYNALFETITDDTLKDGKPKPAQLKMMDEAFVR